MKRILQQILASIKVTNIERYITEAEAILDDVRARNFSTEDSDVRMELDNAKACEACLVFLIDFLCSCCACCWNGGWDQGVELIVGAWSWTLLLFFFIPATERVSGVSLPTPLHLDTFSVHSTLKP